MDIISNNSNTPNDINWRNRTIIPYRRQILREIVKILFERRPSLNVEWREQIVIIAKKLEGRLFFCASSFQEYFDMNTLRERLKEIAKRFSSLNINSTETTNSSTNTNSVTNTNSSTNTDSNQNKQVNGKIILHRMCPSA